MDLSCIISSGDLELYVLGMLPETEAHQIGQLALLFPEVRAELDAISEALEQTALAAAAAAPAPSPGLKGSILDSIRALNASADAAVDGQAAPAIPSSAPPPRVIEFTPPAARRRFPLGMAASLVGLLLCGAGLLYALRQNGDQKQQLAVLQQQVGSLNDSLGNQRRQIETYASLASYLQQPAMQSIRLMPMPNMPQDAMAQVFWDTASHRVMVANLSLPQAPAGKQYQLWAIVDGKPVDAGMLSGTRMKPEPMKTFASAQAFAITLEKEGGSPTPTMEALYVMGKTI